MYPFFFCVSVFRPVSSCPWVRCDFHPLAVDIVAVVFGVYGIGIGMDVIHGLFKLVY